MRIKLVLFTIGISLMACNSNSTKTTVSIEGNQFKINNELTYKDRVWNGNKIEGLLFNSRMVQGIFDDSNPKTRNNFKYPDTGVWDPERNTNEFVAAMQSWRDHGALAFTMNLQGGSPLGYGNHGWINSTFNPDGSLKPEYMARLTKILDKADELGMVVILGYFYFGQDEVLNDETAVLNATDNITDWLLEKDYRNLLIEVNNECNVRYDHDILKEDRVHELITRVRQRSKGKLLVSTSYGGGYVPLSNVVSVADFILIHGNGIHEPEGITELIEKTKNVAGYRNQPILFNEDDHFDFDKEDYNLKRSVEGYVSWGYFDFRKNGEPFETGFQSVPVDWRISTDRKKAFFQKIKEITAY
ncbi:hypothetical protein [uncultured Draconibacterium sp.]|uniref:hypothetical protein n=1 Tax=uncultured Draconibacterium sp. TaxID=1573823 RepID=UPI0029C6F691|nr:hypothetical protein [uncultured Draconibacterium sp.]